MTRSIAIGLFAFALLNHQTGRDTSGLGPVLAGTASLTGIVVSDDTAAQPIRRVRVMLASTDGTMARSDTTDDRGTFVFRDLPAGRYTLSASKPAWLTTHFGATKPLRPGLPITIADAARLTGVTLRMSHGAAITGVVRDLAGQPAVGVQIRVSRLVTRNGERVLENLPAVAFFSRPTDDTGTYRIYGLPPGEVLISAAPGAAVRFNGDEFRRIGAGEIDRALQLAPPSASGTSEPVDTVRLASVFYPGTTDPNAAGVVSLAAGDERIGVDITMQIEPTSRIEGTVTDEAGVPQPRNSVIAMSRGIRTTDVMGLAGAVVGTTDQSGRYVITGVAPGDYTLIGGGEKTWTQAEITVSARTLTVPLTVHPTGVLTGRVVFEGTPAPVNPERLRYSVIGTGLLASVVAVGLGGGVTNGAFTMGTTPGKYQLQFQGVPSGWYPKSAIARGQDTFDLPVEIGPDDRVTEVVVTFTNRPSELAGTLVDAAGRPAPDYVVVVFSADRRFWSVSRRTLQLRPGTDGAFSAKGLPAGDYFIAALTDLEPNEPITAELLETIVAASPPARVTIAEGQRTVQTLKIGGGH